MTDSTAIVAKDDEVRDLYSPEEVQQAWTDADEVLGFTLIKDENRTKLVGVPFLITKVVFREGIGMYDKTNKFDYVTAECIIAPAAAFNKAADMGLFKRDHVPFEPLDRVVFNDGSTGVFRQIVAYLAARDLIVLKDEGVTTNAPKGSHQYDQPRAVWVSGSTEATDGIPVNLRCSRGLRHSEYSNEFGDADTYYLG